MPYGLTFAKRGRKKNNEKVFSPADSNCRHTMGHNGFIHPKNDRARIFNITARFYACINNSCRPADISAYLRQKQAKSKA